MSAVRSFFRYGTFPLFMTINAFAISLIATGATRLWLLPLLVLSIGLMLLIERVIPYNAGEWNHSHGDVLRDQLHFAVNTGLNHAGVLLLPLLTPLMFFPDVWPESWPFVVQVLIAIVVADFGITLAHFLSHKFSLLWRFHAVHHSVKRLYGFNGLMKHPIHQAIETAFGVAPLLWVGVPVEVASALAACVATQLLLQHSNADYRMGPFKYLIACAEVHRFHHRNEAGKGDVNFGLFFCVWDHLLGSFHFERLGAPLRSAEVGIGDEPDYPRTYLAQLIRPFRRAGESVSPGDAGA